MSKLLLTSLQPVSQLYSLVLSTAVSSVAAVVVFYRRNMPQHCDVNRRCCRFNYWLHFYNGALWWWWCLHHHLHE